MKILANTVEYGIDEDQVIFIWFGNTQIKPIEYFKIERAQEFDQQDIELGMDTYNIELNDQKYSLYGGVEKVTLTEQKINFKFDKNGCEKLKLDSLDVVFQLDSKRYSEIKSFLNQIFEQINNN